MVPVPILKRNPVETANPLSRLFFCWMNPFFVKGYKQDLSVDDLYRVPEEDGAHKLGDKLEREWDQQLNWVKQNKIKKPSLGWTLFGLFKWRIAKNGCLTLIEECVTHLAQPLFLAYLIRYCGTDDSFDRTMSYFMAAGIIFTAFALPLTHHPYFFNTGHVGMKMRVAASSLIYRKALRLKMTALDQTTAGQMVNLISSDVNLFDMAMMFVHYLYVGPIQLALVTFVLWMYIGPAVLAGIGVLLMYVPLQFFLSKLFSKFRYEVAQRTDERIRVTMEILSALKVIKMYAWEKSFQQLVDNVRKKELLVLRKIAYTRAINGSIFFTSNKIILLLIFVTLIAAGNALTAEKVYITVALINAVRQIMTQYFPNAVAFVAEMFVTIRRLETFLLLEDVQVPSAPRSPIYKPIAEAFGVRVSNLEGSWNQKSKMATIEGITFSSKPGTLTAIIGPVGSGKSSLLLALLGEFPIHSGLIHVKGKLSFASQEPWTFSGTVRDNILFGQSYDEQLYEKIIDVCALKQDLKELPVGDLTHISDKGGSLSGGQKARVALARAVYFDADVYILDDPLSAVDMCVGHHIFTKCIKELLKDKVCILATHQVHFLKEADQIIALENGRCVGRGTFQQLSTAGIDVVNLLSDTETKSESSTLHAVGLDAECFETRTTEIIRVIIEPNKIEGDVLNEKDKSSMPGESVETSATGAVRIATYIQYFRVGTGVFGLLVHLFLSLLAQALYSGSDYWLSVWTYAEEVRQTGSASGVNGLPPYTYAYIYAGLVAATLVFGLARSLSYFLVCFWSSIGLHDKMFGSIIRSPMTFFHANPIGRILNRFSRDLRLVDNDLPLTSSECFETLLNVFGIVVVVAIVNPWIVIAAAVMFIVLYYLRRVYLHTMRDVRRLEGITRSPIYSHLSTSMNGLAVIRAFRTQAAFVQRFSDHQDIHSAAWYMFLAGNRWLAYRLDFVCAVFIAAVVVTIMLSIRDTPGNNVGLAISSALLLSVMFQFSVRQSTEVEGHMVSVERILEYSELPSEAPMESKPVMTDLLSGWPQHGRIEMKNLSLAYTKGGPWVLKNVNLTIKPGEKIGIVGRTGAGKSSIISALFRLREPDGSILIDDVPITDVGLHDLRKRISIIPQDPVLFSGTIRQNLDPFREHTDEDLWQAMDEVRLKPTLQQFPKGLEAKVSEGGANFSVGQRQLICLARAVLKMNKILILDEATANVDLTTDALIQETVRKKFMNCTVITIAHRLQTVMDSDRILVLKSGSIVECDEPYLLLKNKNGCLFKMVRGTEKSAQLRRIARNKYLANREGDTVVVDIPDGKPKTRL